MTDSLVPFNPAPKPAKVVPTRVNYTKEAFLNRYNLALLAGAVGASLVTLSALPLILIAGVELIFLGTVPAAPRFRRLIDSQQWAHRRMDRRKADQAIYAGLSPNQQATFDSLRDVRDRIGENFTRLSGGSQVLTSQTVSKVDALLSSFIRLLEQLNAYRRHLNATDRGKVDREITELGRDLDAETNERLAEIKRRRLDILGRRIDRFVKGEENREIISHQLAAIDDLMRLMHEQSLTLRDPEDISRQLETLANEVEETEGTVREMETFLRFQDELDAFSRPPG